MLAVNMALGPTIMLHSGALFDFLDPWASEFTIEDVAHGLSNICRYAGQCRAFYSVCRAQHPREPRCSRFRNASSNA